MYEFYSQNNQHESIKQSCKLLFHTLCNFTRLSNWLLRRIAGWRLHSYSIFIASNNLGRFSKLRLLVIRNDAIQILHTLNRLFEANYANLKLCSPNSASIQYIISLQFAFIWIWLMAKKHVISKCRNFTFYKTFECQNNWHRNTNHAPIC